ncbi:MAG TPA: hypothetical protein VH912_12100 [Streptosporangiaceae bacterium]|jgi:hypothetical protein
MTPNEARGVATGAVRQVAPEIEAEVEGVPLDSLDFPTFIELARERGGPRLGTDER